MTIPTVQPKQYSATACCLNRPKIENNLVHNPGPEVGNLSLAGGEKQTLQGLGGPY